MRKTTIGVPVTSPEILRSLLYRRKFDFAIVNPATGEILADVHQTITVSIINRIISSKSVVFEHL
jgi:hypothetical protein